MVGATEEPMRALFSDLVEGGAPAVRALRGHAADSK
jgi:hypothetical protein